MYISAQQILNWNSQYAADRTANRGALTRIDADDPRGWIQGPDFVAPVHTLTGQGYASEGTATFGLTDPMTLWAQQQSDANAAYPGPAALSGSASRTSDPSVDREPVTDAGSPAAGAADSGPEPKRAAIPAGEDGPEPKKAVATAAVSATEPKKAAAASAPKGIETAAKASVAAASGSMHAEPAVQKSPAVDLAAARTSQPAAPSTPVADPVAASTLQRRDTVSGLAAAAQDTRDRYAKLFGALAARGVRFEPWAEV